MVKTRAQTEHEQALQPSTSSSQVPPQPPTPARPTSSHSSRTSATTVARIAAEAAHARRLAQLELEEQRERVQAETNFKRKAAEISLWAELATIEAKSARSVSGRSDESVKHGS
jgi:hypothetical protein